MQDRRRRRYNTSRCLVQIEPVFQPCEGDLRAQDTLDDEPITAFRPSDRRPFAEHDGVLASMALFVSSRTKLEPLATILLPNSVARAGMHQNRV